MQTNNREYRGIIMGAIKALTNTQTVKIIKLSFGGEGLRIMDQGPQLMSTRMCIFVAENFVV